MTKFQKVTLAIAGLVAIAIGAFIAIAPHAFYATYHISLGNGPDLLSDVLAYQNAPRTLMGGTDPFFALNSTFQQIGQTPHQGSDQADQCNEGQQPAIGPPDAADRSFVHRPPWRLAIRRRDGVRLHPGPRPGSIRPLARRSAR